MVSDALLRRKLFQASTDHTARIRIAGDSARLLGCRCGWVGIALHEHQMDELVRAVRSVISELESNGPT